MPDSLSEKQLVIVLEALACDHRLRIIAIISHDRAIPNNVLAGLLDISPQSVSKHTKVLERAGIINELKSGRFKFFELNRKVLDQVGEFIKFKKGDDETKRTETNPSKDPDLRPAGERQDSTGIHDG